MISFYKLSDNTVKKCDKEQRNIIILEDASDKERQDICAEFALPEDLFAASDAAVELTRHELLPDTKLKDAVSLVVMDLSSNRDEKIETRLEPVTIVAAEELLIIDFGDGSTYWQDFLEYDYTFANFTELIGELLLRIYAHFIMELEDIKHEIDALDQSARKTTENAELFKLADTERTVVYLDHSLKDMERTVDAYLEDDRFVDSMAKRLVYRIQLRQRQAEKMVRLYRDLLETIGGLFSDMMDNNLNHLMKYLDSAALVISVPALISGIWGMNVGGLPWEKTWVGFTIVMILGLVLAIVTAVHLYRKDYS
ncbi:magnesium transporter CorA family protein [Lacticaseibacillus zhaodongensis]|uniref:magnesium transporter CorA family protein n=1 Tax=Lacticaseibacillus zhaodongensis TaxID=2668065 RepID=UPI0018AF96F1|nr:magnesium transporter CorA family protein [Lacticaseibacillus zhaodongensis]